MKKCPRCAAVYNDDMSFCLNDGAALTAATQSNLPPTIFQPPSPTTAQNQTPPPAFGNQPPQFDQPPQFNQPPPYNQPRWGSQASTPPPKNSYGGIIVLGVLLLLGVAGIGGGLMIFMFSSASSQTGVYPLASPTAAQTWTPAKTSEYDQSTGQGSPKNGFKQISIQDVTAEKLYPNANKTSLAVYEDGAESVVSYLSVYDTPADAEAAFTKLLEKVKSDGSTVTTRKGNYVYYNKGKKYSTAFWLTNKLYEYSAKNQETLYRFAK